MYIAQVSPHVDSNKYGKYYCYESLEGSNVGINSNIKDAKVQEVHGLNPIEVVKPKSGYPTEVVIHW